MWSEARNTSSAAYLQIVPICATRYAVNTVKTCEHVYTRVYAHVHDMTVSARKPARDGVHTCRLHGCTLRLLTHANVHTRKRAHTQTCTHANVQTRKRAHTQTCTHANVHTRTHAHAHTHVRTHARTHVQLPSGNEALNKPYFRVSLAICVIISDTQRTLTDHPHPTSAANA